MDEQEKKRKLKEFVLSTQGNDLEKANSLLSQILDDKLNERYKREYSSLEES